MIRIETVNLDVAERIVALLAPRIEAAGRVATNVIAGAVMEKATDNANTGHHPRGQGHIPGTGPGPNTVTTDLKTQIAIFPRQGFGSYTVDVGSTVDYARTVELGNPRWKRVQRGEGGYPYLGPAGDEVSKTAYFKFANAFAAAMRNG